MRGLVVCGASGRQEYPDDGYQAKRSLVERPGKKPVGERR
jgi:hypothetical protein